MEDNFLDKERTPFRTPENFFEQFNERLSGEIAKRKRARKAIILKYAGSAAAAIAIIATTTVAVNNTKQAKLDEEYAQMEALAESPEKYLSNEELQAWVNFYENDIFLNN